MMADPTASSNLSIAAALEVGARAAAAWKAHALGDLTWSDADRPDEALRSSAHTLWHEVALSIARAVAEPLGWATQAEAAVAVLIDADWMTAERLRPALVEAQHRTLRARLIAAAKPFGATDPLDELSRKTGRTGALARDLLATRDVKGMVLPLEAWHELCWACAGALRVLAKRAAKAMDDAALRTSVAATLAQHDEAAGSTALAGRLARRLTPDRLLPGEALLAGHTRLAVALLAERVELPAEQLGDWLLAPDPFAFAVALRAGGEDAAGVGGLLATLAVARGQPVSGLTDRIAALHTLDVDGARAMLRDWRR